MRSIHIVFGMIGIISGVVALITLKGGTFHRRIGMVFVLSMCVMCGTGVLLALLRQPGPGNVVAGTLTFYMVVTALLTVRRPRRHARTIDTLAMWAALTLAVMCIGLGLFRRDPTETPGGYPPPAYFILGAVTLLAALQDIRMISAGRLEGSARLKRHLGRMGGAMIVATASFFLGQPQIFAGGPLEPIGLRAVPVFVVVSATVYWRARVSRRMPAVS